MKKLLLFCIGLMLSSLASFGQSSFKLPQASSVIGVTPAFLGSSVFHLKNGIPDAKIESASIEEYRQISSFRSGLSPVSGEAEITHSEGSNMPIIDLSKGYSSNLIIKEFPKNFLSRMPITELKLPNLILLEKK